MAGTVYLRTNKFEVKLEGITFKARDFESVCKAEFFVPESNIRFIQQPVVGIDVMNHPRDPSIVLVLLCFGVGCVILRFASGEELPEPIFRFLTDKRIRFVGFGIPEKKDLFPFEELGLTKSKVDIGYVAAKVLDDPKYKNSELSELARKVLGVSKMVGLTAASSFERHEQVKCAICQLFLSTVIAMTLLRADYKKKLAKNPSSSPKSNEDPKKKNLTTCTTPKKKKFANAAKMIACLKGMDTLSRVNGELWNMPDDKKKQRNSSLVEAWFKEPSFWDIFRDSKRKEEGEGIFRDSKRKEEGEDIFRDSKRKEEGEDIFRDNKRKEEGENKSTKVVENWNDIPSIFENIDDKSPEPVKEKEKEKERERESMQVIEMNEDCLQQAQAEALPFCDYNPMAGFFWDDCFHTEAKKNDNVAGFFWDDSFLAETKKNDNVAQIKESLFSEDCLNQGSSSDESVPGRCTGHCQKKPLKGILKCPSTGLENFNLSPSKPSTPPPTPRAGCDDGRAKLRRANSKGYNVSFKQ